MSGVAGPLGGLVSLHHGQDGPGLRITSGGRPSSSPNANLLLKRLAWDTTGPDQDAATALRTRAAAAMFPGALLSAAHRRRDAAIERLRQRNLHCQQLRIRPVWRLAVGLGDDSPTEVGMRLHGTYGTPVLPGSALKGVARAQARTDTDNYRASERAVFGQAPQSGGTRTAGEDTAGENQDRADDAAAGQVMFLDALPDISAARKRDLVVSDLVNPHVPDYYRTRGAVPPAQYLQPVPVPFLAVTSAVTFRVVLISRRDPTDVPASQALRWLSDAVDELGIGGKTSAGYGYLEIEPVEKDTEQTKDPARTATGGKATGGKARRRR